jgi:hypothetical protein
MTTEDSFRNQITRALQRRDAFMNQCPMCTARSWTLITGVIVQDVYFVEGRVMKAPSSSLPSIALVCNQCAFIAQYSTKALGLEITRG